ncbi:flagellar assembly protein FliW [Cellulomonas sp. JZ18]|nr:flagellar assembly protein FliW [Cellulomonas sp. JZ18]
MSRVAVSTPDGPRDVPAVLRLVAELPGLPGHDEFSLEPLDDEGVLFALRSAPEGARAVRLFVVAPHVFFADYAPELEDDVLRTLDPDDDAADPVLLAVVHPADDDRARHSANLLAPVVVEPRHGRARQVVLDADLPLRAPLG